MNNKIGDLLVNGFSCRSFQEKMDIIKKVRPTPDIKLETKTKNCIRYFNKEKYTKYEWLSGCENKNSLYCWPCVLFSSATEKNVWNSGAGFVDMNNFFKCVKRHETSANHLKSMMSFKTFGKNRIEFSLDKSNIMLVKKNNDIVTKNRKIVKSLIDVVSFLGMQELSFRGHDESVTSPNRGNYIELVTLLAQHNTHLEEHLKNATVFSGLSSKIQNDLVCCISSVIQEAIFDEIKRCDFISLIVDESTDVTNNSQMTIVVRYVNSDEGVFERFIKYENVSSNKDATTIASIILEFLKNHDLQEKIVAQSYDGAAVMSGKTSGVQAIVKNSFPDAIYIHCFAHRLSLVMQKSVQSIKQCAVFFKTLSGLSAFFTKSPKRSSALASVMDKHMP